MTGAFCALPGGATDGNNGTFDGITGYRYWWKNLADRGQKQII